MLLSIEKIENLEQKIKNIERDKETVQKQYTESMRSYEIADERLMELRLKLKDSDEKLKNLDATKEKNSALEKELTILQVRFEGLIKEEAMKRDYLEKDLRREFELKFKEKL